MCSVLIIDDDAALRTTLRDILEEFGASVIEAGDGVLGVALFAKEKPSIVFTDILMPNKEGVETITEIRAMDTNVKIVAMSGGGVTRNMTFLNLSRSMGADIVLEKPIGIDRVAETLRTLAPGAAL